MIKYLKRIFGIFKSMEWTHKNVKISVCEDGYFHFTHNGKTITSNSLSEARYKIDDATETYYKFTKADFTKMFKKLDARDQDFVKNLIDELNLHSGNAYCEIGISDDFLFSYENYE